MPSPSSELLDPTDTVDSLLKRLEQLNQIGVSLSRERDITRLLEGILLAAKSITGADGGTLYRVVDGGKALRFEILRTESLNVAMGGSSGVPIRVLSCSKSSIACCIGAVVWWVLSDW